MPPLIRNPVIRNGDYYSPFFVFEIKHNFNISKNALFSSPITPPVQVKTSVSNENSSNSNENSIKGESVIPD